MDTFVTRSWLPTSWLPAAAGNDLACEANPHEARRIAYVASQPPNVEENQSPLRDRHLCSSAGLHATFVRRCGRVRLSRRRVHHEESRRIEAAVQADDYRFLLLKQLQAAPDTKKKRKNKRVKGGGKRKANPVASASKTQHAA